MTPQKNPIPEDFAAIFGRLARRTATPRLFDARTLPDYYAALANVPIATLDASAEQWARWNRFFPTVAEWLTTAIGLTDADGRRLPLQRDCTRCANRGLIAVRYESGDAFDVAICDCEQGCIWRKFGADVVRARLRLSSPDHRVAYVEDFAE